MFWSWDRITFLALKILLLNQTFYPDPVATSQYLTTLALELAARGHEVTVFAGNHGYDDPSQRFPLREEYQGVRIRRIGYTQFGKKFKLGRAADFASFLFNLSLRLLVLPRQGRVVALTSPPLIAFLGAVHCRLKGGELVQWVMDLNPDEAIAAGWLKENSFLARFLKFVSRWTFRQCGKIIALDRFMKSRLVERYGVPAEKISVIPPWAHDDDLKPLAHDKNPFRQKHGLDGKFVVMYSGNHSPCHPLDTVLEAALGLRDDPGVVFYFVGGGSLMEQIARFKEGHDLRNIIQLPYQPLSALAESLSAADLHLIVMGDLFVGILHPCKVYGVLAVGRPFVFIGPQDSHIGDLIKESGLGIQLPHGRSQDLIDAIQRVRRMAREPLSDIQKKEIALKDSKFSRRDLCARTISAIESAV